MARTNREQRRYIESSGRPRYEENKFIRKMSPIAAVMTAKDEGNGYAPSKRQPGRPILLLLLLLDFD
jgi:hypothetical protein